MTDSTPGLDLIRGRYCDGAFAQTGLLTEGTEFDRAMAKVRSDTLLEAAEAMAGEGGDTLWDQHSATMAGPYSKPMFPEHQAELDGIEAAAAWLQKRATQ